jgi:hypothetical protein
MISERLEFPRTTGEETSGQRRRVHTPSPKSPNLSTLLFGPAPSRGRIAAHSQTIRIPATSPHTLKAMICLIDIVPDLPRAVIASAHCF